MSTMPAHGRWVDFAGTRRLLTWYQQLRALGIQGVCVDAMTDGWQQDYHRAGEAGLARMVFQGYYAPLWADVAQARPRAEQIVPALEAVGYQGTVWLDCEAMDGLSDQQAIDWINAWAETVEAALGKGTSGIYVGAGVPLTGTQLYQDLIVTHYWRSASQVPAVATRGYQGVQHLPLETDLAGYAVDLDDWGPDLLGAFAQAMPGVAVPAAVPADGTAQVAQLAQRLAAVEATLARVRRAWTG